MHWNKWVLEGGIVNDTVHKKDWQVCSQSQKSTNPMDECVFTGEFDRLWKG